MPLAEIRKKIYSLSAYLDNIFLQGENDSECVFNICDTMQMIRKLGFVVNIEKSQVEQLTKPKVLGFSIDLVKIKVPQTDDDEFVNIVSETAKTSFVKIKKLSQVIRKFVGINL